MDLDKEQLERNGRKNQRRKLVKIFGGKCMICGYSKCFAALSFHHLNPKEKEFTLGAYKSYRSTLIEAAKCILVCNNCHTEIHQGLVKISDHKLPSKDEIQRLIDKEISLIDILETRRKAKDSCPICKKPKAIKNKFCSIKCSAVSRGIIQRRINWDEINLLKLLKTNSIMQLARKFNVSYNTILKHKNRLLKNPI